MEQVHHRPQHINIKRDSRTEKTLTQQNCRIFSGYPQKTNSHNIGCCLSIEPDAYLVYMHSPQALCRSARTPESCPVNPPTWEVLSCEEALPAPPSSGRCSTSALKRPLKKVPSLRARAVCTSQSASLREYASARARLARSTSSYSSADLLMSACIARVQSNHHGIQMHHNNQSGLWSACCASLSSWHHAQSSSAIAESLSTPGWHL